MLGDYETLRKFDVTPYIDKYDNVPYLNWAKCIELLHVLGAEKVYFEPIPDEKTGSSLRMTDVVFTDKNGGTNRVYETRIRIVIDDHEYIMQTPVLNGKNPVKDNSMTQSRVWTSMCRAFVKGVAIHTGLGFSLWLKEETENGDFLQDIPVEKRDADKAQKKVLEHYAKTYHLNLEKWAEMNGTSMERLTELEAAKMLRSLQEKYGDLQPQDGKA